MARTSKANSTADAVTVEETTVTADSVAVEKNMNVEKKVTKPRVNPLEDSDEIDVASMIPNVSYKDSYTNDMYKWNEVGHVEQMTFATLKNMWRNSKGYFRNMWLKPLDERVIEKFGLTNTYKNHEFMMNDANYTRANIKKICENISNAPNGMKYAICNKIKDLVVNGEITDVVVIRSIEKLLDLDLISLLA